MSSIAVDVCDNYCPAEELSTFYVSFAALLGTKKESVFCIITIFPMQVWPEVKGKTLYKI